MALVFKISHGDTLRRWVVSESGNIEMFPVTLDQSHAKIRELFQLPASVALAITYLDRENDWVTVGDDHDLVDACIVQHLNPLRLKVQVLESKSSGTDRANQEAPDLNIESFLKLLFPNETSEVLQRFLQRFALDPSLPVVALIQKAQDAFKEFMAHVAQSEFPKPGPSEKCAHRRPDKHPFGDTRSNSMPNRGEHTSPNDWYSFPAYHLGVKCDGCGATPIQGPRYTSNKVPKYDLCSSCYQEKGNEDYNKIEHPLFPWSVHDHQNQLPCLMKGVMQFMGQQYMSPPMGGQGFCASGSYGWRPENDFGNDDHKNLDAHFVKDVTIFDGTEMAPGTKFTKIWCMSNSGSLAWPQNTKLLHIDGDALCLQEAVNIELPEEGLACGEKIEVSVDLTAPEKAGRYISHWSLASPEGQKFGQRVWVTIQVLPQGEQSPVLQQSINDSGETNSAYKSSTGNKSAIDVPIVLTNEAEKEHVLHSDFKRSSTVKKVSGSSMRDSDQSQDRNITQNVPNINEELEGYSFVEKPLVEFDDEEMTDKAENLNNVENHEELDLRSLESMGFVDRELNAVLLSKNKGNVQHTVDDLLVAAGWSAAARDLQEMGFADRTTNVILLLKHKGNFKAVVRDLVRMGKQKA